MVPTRFFYQLGLVALVWVCLMLYGLWPPGAARRQPSAIATPPRRKRSHEPKALAAVYAGDGGRMDRPCVDAARSAALARTTVATAPDGLRKGAA